MAARWEGNFYVDPDNKITAVEVNTRGDSLQLGTPHALFQARLQNVEPPYSVTSDGKRFMVNEQPASSASSLTVVFNWDADLRK